MSDDLEHVRRRTLLRAAGTSIATVAGLSAASGSSAADESGPIETLEIGGPSLLEPGEETYARVLNDGQFRTEMELCPEFIRDPGDFSLCSTRHDEYQHEWGRRLSISPTEPGHYTVFALVYELDGNQAIGWENAHLAVVGEDVSYEWPVPALEAPSTVEVGEAVTLDASDSEPIGGAQNSRLSAYEFSGDVEHEGESPIHTVTFDEPGTKEVSLRVEGTLDPMEGGLRTPVVGWSRETATVTIEVEDLDTSWWDPYTDDDHVVPDSDHSDAAIQDYHAGEISLDQVLMIIDSYETGDPVADAQWWQPYTNDDGTVDTDGLRRALDDWRADELTTERQRIIIDHWRSGEPIDA